MARSLSKAHRAAKRNFGTVGGLVWKKNVLVFICWSHSRPGFCIYPSLKAVVRFKQDRVNVFTKFRLEVSASAGTKNRLPTGWRRRRIRKVQCKNVEPLFPALMLIILWLICWKSAWRWLRFDLLWLKTLDCDSNKQNSYKNCLFTWISPSPTRLLISQRW